MLAVPLLPAIAEGEDLCTRIQNLKTERDRLFDLDIDLDIKIAAKQREIEAAQQLVAAYVDPPQVVAAQDAVTAAENALKIPKSQHDGPKSSFRNSRRTPSR